MVKSAAGTLDLSSILGWVKLKNIKVGIHYFLAYFFQQWLRQCEASTVCGWQIAAWLEDYKIDFLSFSRSNLTKSDIITIFKAVLKWLYKSMKLR